MQTEKSVDALIKRHAKETGIPSAQLAKFIEKIGRETVVHGLRNAIQSGELCRWDAANLRMLAAKVAAGESSNGTPYHPDMMDFEKPAERRAFFMSLRRESRMCLAEARTAYAAAAFFKSIMRESDGEIIDAEVDGEAREFEGLVAKTYKAAVEREDTEARLRKAKIDAKKGLRLCSEEEEHIAALSDIEVK